MKPKDKILTYSEARELKWFSDNCIGLRQEYYELLDKFTAFKNKLDRLNKTSELIENYYKEEIESVEGE